MGEEPLHWSERAKLASPSAFPPVSVPGPPPPHKPEKMAPLGWTDHQQPWGLGGWLVLPIIGLFLTIVTSVVTTFRSILPTFESGTWSYLTTPGTDLYDSLWGPFFMFDIFVTAVMIVFPVFLLILLFQKKRLLPRLIIWFYAFDVFALLVESMGLLSFSADLRQVAGWSTSSIVRDLLEGLLAPAIWIPYFLLSKRVRNTFVGSPS